MRILAFACAFLVLAACAFAVAPTNPGDINGDSAVNAADAILVASCLGQPAASCQSGRADPNNDGIVNLFDFIAVSQSWGRSYGTANTNTVLFSSDWSSGSLLDGGKWVRWGDNGLLTIVPASGLGFPAGMTNVYRVTHLNQGFDWIMADNKWSVPAIGQSLYFRAYFRNEVANTIDGGTAYASTHPLESNAVAGGAGGNMYSFHYATYTDGTFPFFFDAGDTAPWPYNGWTPGAPSSTHSGRTYDPATLNKFTTYRIEWKLTRRAANRYDLDMRIYGADDNTLLFDRNNIYAWTGSLSDTLAAHGTNLPLDDSFITDLRIGINGGFQTTTPQYAYWGGIQVCQDDWCGPYGGSNPPPPDTTNPTVALSAPANGATVSSAVTVSATASDNVGVVGVQFTLDGANLGAEDTSSPYSISWTSTGTPNGAHTLGAVARDAAGNTASAAPRTVTVSNAAPDTVNPTVTLTAPADGATVSTSTTVSATAADNVAVQSVQFLIDGANLGAADTTAPYSVTLNPASYPVGTHTIAARASDTSANTATSTPITITIIDNTAPTATITAPSANQAFPSTTTSVTLSVTSSEAATCKYGTSTTQTYAQLPFTMTATTATSHTAAISGLTNNASYTYAVRCQDTAGNAMTGAQSVTFTISAPGGSGGTGSVLFFSDWRTATGTSVAAIQDGGKWTRWGDNGLLTVVPATGHGFPAGMQNVYQVLHGTQSFDWVEANNKWTMPAIGESRAYRIYMRSEFGSFSGGWAATHPLESQGTDGGISGNFYALHVGSDTANTFPFSFATAAGWPWNYLIVGNSGGSDITRLNKQTTYRLEWKWTRTATSTYTLDMRIYGADDSTILYDKNSIYGWGGGTLASHQTGYPVDAAFITGLRVGLNGGFAASGNQYFYWGGFAVCDDWCGAYNPSTG